MGVNIMSAVKDRGTTFHEIVMITIATYTFTKVTIAVIGMVKAKRSASPVLKTLRNISLADACVSVYTCKDHTRYYSGGLLPCFRIKCNDQLDKFKFV